MGKVAFFKESIKNLKTVGTFTRSSKPVCKNMVSHIDFNTARVIVEIGAGDGAITQHILNGMHKDARLLSFEVNEKFCATLREIDDPRFTVIEDSCEKIGHYLNEIGAEKADAIVSAVPFVAFPKEVAKKLVEECSKYLKKDSPYIQIHYSLLTKKLYASVFGNVDLNFVPINFPPAWVLVSKKED